jgi:hypothetical protein
MGAGPGRWTGRGIQPQNLVRFDDDTQPLADALLEVLNDPASDGMLDNPDATKRWAYATRAASDIEKATDKNPIIVISKCIRVFIKAPS